MKLAWTLPIICVIAVAVVWHQTLIRKLIYFPEQSVAETDSQWLKEHSFELFNGAPYSEDFRGHLKRAKDPRRLVMIFHGNAGNAAMRTYMARGFLNDETTVFLAEYPGYGPRPGTPTEQNIYQAALDDFSHLKFEYPEASVILMGESLGTGVASWLAKRVKPKAVILVSPFTSLVEVGKIHYPFLPANALLMDRFDSLEHLKETMAPLLVIHGDQDDIVPHALGKKLFEFYQGQKQFLTLPGFAHNNLPWEDTNGVLWGKIKSWLEGNGL